VISGDFSLDIDTNRSITRRTEGDLSFSEQDYNDDQERYDSFSLSGVAFGNVAGSPDNAGGFTVNGASGVLHVDVHGHYTYSLNQNTAGLTGTETFTVSVTDEFGAVRDQNVVINLVTLNQDPGASQGREHMDTWRDGGQMARSVILSDADGDSVAVNSVAFDNVAGIWDFDPNNDPAFVVQGDYGTLYLHADGSYLYALAAPGVSGTETFTYTVVDQYGGTDANSITIILNNENSAPIVSGDLLAAVGGSFEDYANGLVLTSGVISWADNEGDAIASVTVGGVALPSTGDVTVNGTYGTLTVNANGGYTYTLNPGVHEQAVDDVEQFEIVVTDVYGAAVPANLRITLTPLSHAPECHDELQTWQTGMSLVFGALSYRDADEPHENLQLAVNNVGIGSPTGVAVAGLYGTLIIKADGAYIYTTTHLREPLLESFTYTVTDSDGNIGTANLYIRLSDAAPPFPDSGPFPSPSPSPFGGESFSSEEPMMLMNAFSAPMMQENEESGGMALSSGPYSEDDGAESGLFMENAQFRSAGIMALGAFEAPLMEENEGSGEMGLFGLNSQDNGVQGGLFMEHGSEFSASPFGFSGMENLLNFGEAEELFIGLPNGLDAGLFQEIPAYGLVAENVPSLAVGIEDLLDAGNLGGLDALLAPNAPALPPEEGMSLDNLAQTLHESAPAAHDIAPSVASVAGPALEAFEQQAVLDATIKTHFG
jgi:VCBS repeat-containing protein